MTRLKRGKRSWKRGRDEKRKRKMVKTRGLTLDPRPGEQVCMPRHQKERQRKT